MNEMLSDPVMAVAGFLLFAALAVGVLLNSMKSGGSAMGIIIALLLAAIAAYFAPFAFGAMNQTGFE